MSVTATARKHMARLAELRTERKRIAKEEDALVQWFMEQAAGKDMTWKTREMQISLVTVSNTILDHKAIRIYLGDEITKFQRESVYQRMNITETKAKKVA